jgi:phage gpG-like protein
VSSNAARDVAAKLREIRRLAESEAPMAACRAVGQTAETAVKVTLTTFTRTEDEITPSKPGQPPALVTGDLRRSIRRTPPVLVAPGRAGCQVGSLLVYAPVHEYGTTIRAKNGAYLKFKYGGSWHAVRKVTIPKRPFLATATRRLTETGMLRRVAEDAWRAAMKL